MYQLLVTNPLGEQTREYYLVDSGLKYRIEGEVETPQGAITVLTTIESYKEFNGVKFPGKVEEKAGGQRIITTLEDVKMNKDVPMNLFE